MHPLTRKSFVCKNSPVANVGWQRTFWIEKKTGSFALLVERASECKSRSCSYTESLSHIKAQIAYEQNNINALGSAFEIYFCVTREFEKTWNWISTGKVVSYITCASDVLFPSFSRSTLVYTTSAFSSLSQTSIHIHTQAHTQHKLVERVINADSVLSALVNCFKRKVRDQQRRGERWEEKNEKRVGMEESWFGGDRYALASVAVYLKERLRGNTIPTTLRCRTFCLSSRRAPYGLAVCG